jgi:hypothetical protein
MEILAKRRAQREHQTHQAAPHEFLIVVQRRIRHLASVPHIPCGRED